MSCQPAASPAPPLKIPANQISSFAGPSRRLSPTFLRLMQRSEWMNTSPKTSTLIGLAAQAGLSRFHFHRLFKSAVGVSPSRYYINLRMNVARQLLRETKKSVVDVALDVDYTNPSHFAKLFRRETGHSPVPRMFPRLSATHTFILGLAVSSNIATG